MYFEKAISKINNISWGVIGENRSGNYEDLGYEFLRRMALFFKENRLDPLPPSMTNIAKLLGDTKNRLEISNYCTLNAIEFLNESLYTKKVFEYYLQLARYADEYPKVSRYLEIYEILIKVIELGGCFYLKHNELEIEGKAYYPLKGWFERFSSKEPVDISKI